MFNYIKGEIQNKNESQIILENNGIGYEINASLNTIELCGSVGEDVKLYTYFSVKEDGVSLFGFFSIEEKNLFLNLISVSGVGPKMALQILSGAKLSDLTNAISREDISLLSKIKGIGKKTSERIIVELKDKIGNINLFNYDSVVSYEVSNNCIEEAIEVLISLGLSKSDANRCVKIVYKDGDSTEDLVSKSLHNIGR